MRVAVVGAGYVGLASGLTLAHGGHDVVVIDVDAPRIATLRAGQDPLGEEHVTTLLARRMVTFTTDAAEALGRAAAVLIAVGTPPTSTGAADLSFLERAAETIAKEASGAAVFIRSTVPVGTADRLQEGTLRDFTVVSNPEFLREGHAIADSLWPDRVVAGGDTSAEAIARELYDPILSRRFEPLGGEPATASPPSRLMWMDRRSAELSKYAANAFLATKLSFVNEIANVAASVGADIRAVTRVIGSDPRIGAAFLRPGIGWGGSCFPKDTRALASFAFAEGYDFTVLRAVIEQNNAQLLRFFALIKAEVSRRPRPRIGLLGLAFKSGTSDCRESPAIALAHLMVDARWDVVAYDPAVRSGNAAVPQGVTVVTDIEQVAADADALVIATEWPEFAEADYLALRRVMRGDVVLDGRCIVSPERVQAAGLRYRGVCPPAARDR